MKVEPCKGDTLGWFYLVKAETDSDRIFMDNLKDEKASKKPEGHWISGAPKESGYYWWRMGYSEYEAAKVSYFGRAVDPDRMHILVEGLSYWFDAEMAAPLMVHWSIPVERPE